MTADNDGVLELVWIVVKVIIGVLALAYVFASIADRL